VNNPTTAEELDRKSEQEHLLQEYHYLSMRQYGTLTEWEESRWQSLPARMAALNVLPQPRTGPSPAAGTMPAPHQPGRPDSVSCDPETPRID
jgi:hypothetical protein